MIGRLKELLAGGPVADPAREQERVRVATCVLLLELAHADGEFHAMETQLVEDLVQDRFDLDPEDARELLALAQGEREDSLDLYQFTRQINDNFSNSEKEALLEELWHVVYVDGVLDKYEEYLMRRLTDLLRLSHRQMIDAKLKVLRAESPPGDG